MIDSVDPRGRAAPLPDPLRKARAGSLMLGAAPLLRIPQAALLAGAVQQMAEGPGPAATLLPAFAFLALGVLRATCEAWGARRVFGAARAWLSGLRAEALNGLARHSPLDRSRAASGAAASVVAEQAEAVLPWLTRYQPARWRVLLVPPMIALVVSMESWLAALVLVGAAPLIPLFMALAGWRARAASSAQLEAMGGLNGFLLDRLRGLATLRALGAIDITARRVRETAEVLRAGTMRVLRIAFLSSAALELFSALAVAMVAVYVGFHLLGQIAFGSWGQPLDLGQGLFVLLLAPAFFQPFRELAAAWHDKAAGEAAQAALLGLRPRGLALPGALDVAEPVPGPAPAGAAQPGGALCKASRAPSVTVAGLRFCHPGGQPVFAGLDLDIAAGEHVALVGASGAGKSTLLALLAGLVPPTGGRILIDGTPLDDASAARLRRAMAWIGQRPHVFAGTALGNVALGRPGLAGDAAAALRRIGLGHTALAEPGCQLGEGGMGLSGGELVRLALARVAATPAAGLLLADEPTAHLDRETAASVIDTLLRLAEGRTLVVATHDRVLAARIGRVVDLDVLSAAGRPAGRAA